MRHILLSNEMSPSDKEDELNTYFFSYQPKTSPFLLGEFALTHGEYESLSEYFLNNELQHTFYRYPLIFALLITEFAYWTDDWHSNESFWESFETKYRIPFSQHVYRTIRKGYGRLKVISQPETGFKYVNWCTMQSILGRNAIVRLAELIQYFKKKDIKRDEIIREFETSYIVDLKLAVLGHLYKLSPSTVIAFLESLIKGEYRNCIYFRGDEKFIGKFEELLKQRFFYARIFSSQQIAPPVFFLEDNRIKYRFFEDSPINFDPDVEIKQFKGQNIIAKYRNNVRLTKWQRSKLFWAESFNTFIQSSNQTVDFYLEDSGEKIACATLPKLSDKEFWIFDSEGDLLNDEKDEIYVNFEEGLIIQFVTSAINKIANLRIEEEPACYPDEEEYFLFKFTPDLNKIRETLGTYDLIYDFPNSIRFNALPVFINEKDSLPVLSELPEIYIDRDILMQDVLIGINDEEIPVDKIAQSLIQEESFHILHLENVYSWNPFGRNRMDILTERGRSPDPFQFYYLRDLEQLKLLHLKTNYQLVIQFSKKGYEVVANPKPMRSKSYCFAMTADGDNTQDTQDIEFSIKRLKRDETLHLTVHTIFPTARVMLRQKNLELSEIHLIDLRNLPLAIELGGQPDQRFDLRLISDDNNLLCQFGTSFTLSSSGRFSLGRAFWLKYYTLISKRLNGESGFIEFSYNYSIPFLRPFSFTVCKLIAQLPLVRQFNLSTDQRSLAIQLEIEKLPLNTLSLYLFNSDFTAQRKYPLEDDNRLPSQKLMMYRNLEVSDFVTEGILYACLAISDRILSELKQVNIGYCENRKHLTCLIDLLFTNKKQKSCENKFKEMSHHLKSIFNDQSELSNLIRFLNKPEINDIFRGGLVKLFMNNKLSLLRLLLRIDTGIQMQFIRFIFTSSALDFFHLSEKETKSLHADNYKSSRNAGLFEKWLTVKLYGYDGLVSEEQSFLKENDYFPPFSFSQPFLKEIKADLESVDESFLSDVKPIGKLADASERLETWYFNLQKKAREISDLFANFYNYWLLSKQSQRKKIFQAKIVETFTTNPSLFFRLMILREIVDQWETNRLGIPHEFNS